MDRRLAKDSHNFQVTYAQIDRLLLRTSIWNRGALEIHVKDWSKELRLTGEHVDRQVDPADYRRADRQA